MSDGKTTSVATPLSRDEVEETVVRIWTEILGELPENTRTHFFDFGGQSLAAMRVISRLRREWGEQLPTRLIFDHPVLADFAASAMAFLAGLGRVADPARRH